MYSVVNYDICKHTNHIRLHLFLCGCATVEPSEWKGTVINPAFSRLYYVISGKASITTMDNTKIMLLPGKWYFLPSGCSFNYECHEQMEHLYIHLKLCDFDETDLFYNCPRPVRIPLSNGRTDFIRHCLTSADVTDALFLHHFVYEILLSMIKNEGIELKSFDYSPCVFNALQYIKNNLSMTLTVSEICKNAFVSKSTLTKHFRKELSTSVNKYICDKILSESERLLSTSNLSVFDISEKFGFSDQFYFSRLFKEKFGVSPREYRKNKLL